MPVVTRGAKTRQNALAAKKNKPAAKRQASQTKAKRGPLVQETPAKKKTAEQPETAGKKTTTLRATGKRAVNVKKPAKQSAPAASATAAPPKSKSKPGPKPKPAPKSTAEKPVAAKKPTVKKATAGKKPAKQKTATEPAASKRAAAKRALDEDEPEDEDSISDRTAPRKRARRAATAAEAQAEPRWAEKNKNDDEADDEVQDESGGGGVTMAILADIKDAVIEAIRTAISEITMKDKKNDVVENEDEPAASLTDDFQDLTVALAPKKPNEEVEIPKELDAVVTRSSDGNAFDFNITMPELNKSEPLLWALKNEPKAVKVQLQLSLCNNQQSIDCFRVALSFQLEDEQFDEELSFCDSTKPWSPDNAGVELDNFLALSLSRDLHAALENSKAQDPSEILTKVFDVVGTALSDIKCGTHCVVCSNPLNTKVWRPVACSSECKETMAAWPLELLMSPLLLDHLVLDFLLGCLNSMRDDAIVNMSANLPAPVKNIDSGCIRAAIKSFPKLDMESTVSSIQDADDGGEGRRTAMMFLSFIFQGCLVSASKAARVSYIAPENTSVRRIHQFVLLNSTVDRQVNFRTNQAARSPGYAAFHGTPPRNLLPILADGLQAGRANIFFGSCFETSVYYQRGEVFRSWPQSVFKDTNLIFGLENRGRPQNEKWFDTLYAEANTAVQSEVMVRNVFIYRGSVNHTMNYIESTLDFRLGTETREVMEKTFRLIHEDHIEEVRGPARLHSKRKVTAMDGEGSMPGFATLVKSQRTSTSWY